VPTALALPSALHAACPAGGWAQPAVAAAGADDADRSLGAAARLLEGFPGPLSAATPRDKMAKWLAERSERCGPEEGGALAGERAEALRSLWEALRLMARHGGHLRPVAGGLRAGARARIAAVGTRGLLLQPRAAALMCTDSASRCMCLKMQI
jgi:hypothetical protein